LDVRDTVLVPIGLPLPPSELMLAVRLVERSYVAPIRDTDTAIPIRRYCDMAFFKNKDTPIRQVYKYAKKSEYTLEEQSANKNGNTKILLVPYCHESSKTLWYLVLRFLQHNNKYWLLGYYSTIINIRIQETCLNLRLSGRSAFFIFKHHPFKFWLIE
jgi:hypothetical protein